MTLTETAQFTKRGLRALLILGTLFLILWIGFLYVYNNIYLPHLRDSQKPEKRFSTLPTPAFPPTVVNSSTLTYNLDTESGFLPSGFPRLVKVYFIPTKTITLLAPDRAQSLAQSLGFIPIPQILSATQYRFRDAAEGQLTIDLNTGNFNFTRKITAPTADQISQFGTADQVAQDFKNYLDSKGLLADSFQQASSKVTFDHTDPRISTTALVALFPGNQDNLPIVSSNPDTGLISTTVTKYSDEKQKYLSLSYTVWPVDSSTVSTYQLIPVAQSFTNLKKGLGVIVRKPSSSTISIHSVYLAYFMSNTYSPFLQPVYVYQGDNFLAYVPALTPDSYAQASSNGSGK